MKWLLGTELLKLGVSSSVSFGEKFAYCDLRKSTPKNLRICDSGMSPRIYGFTICGFKKKVCTSTFDIRFNPSTAGKQKSATKEERRKSSNCMSVYF
jgi:hypothetical protein